MTTEWTQEAEDSGECHTVQFGEKKFGEFAFGETVQTWSGEEEESPTVTEE